MVCQLRGFPGHAPKGAILLAVFYRLTRKRVNVLFDTHLVICIVLLQLIPDILLYARRFRPTVLT